MTGDGAVCQVLISMPGSVDQWGLIELQGQVETRDQISFNDMHIGDLHFNTKGVPSLIVGHHLLTGKIVDLEKPYAILKKRTRTANSESDSNNGTKDSEMDEEKCITAAAASNTTEYEVVALITKRILFSNRPKPIITKTVTKK